MVSCEEENPEEVAAGLVDELEQYSPFLADKPRMYVLTKTDLIDVDELKVPKGWYHISSVQNEGVKELMVAMEQKVSEERLAELAGEMPTISVG